MNSNVLFGIKVNSEAGRRTHHVVEASEEGDVREAHQLGIVDSKTANAN